MGGMIAAEMAAVMPREVERLGLIAPAGLWLDAHPVPDLFSKLPHELLALLFHDAALGERMIGDFDDPKFLEAFISRNTRQLALASKLLLPVPDRGLDERPYRIRAKIVLVWGDSDRIFPPAYGDAFRRGITGAELVRIPAGGHMGIVEQSDAVVAAGWRGSNEASRVRVGRPHRPEGKENWSESAYSAACGICFKSVE
jgi:pimeloyl-ACP methyl ester carboxylesterase